ncbi:MAG: hypothetical protein IIC64_11220 [SAR324 cluster bacterium]|nr:hypothetical protein [SAR324 cluster bacterium]
MSALQTRVIKIGAKVVKHARYTCFQMAEVSISRNLFAAIPRRIRYLMRPVPVKRPSLPVKMMAGFEIERKIGSGLHCSGTS